MRLSDLASEYPRDTLTFNIVKEKVGTKLRTLSKPSPNLKAMHRQLVTYLEERVGVVRFGPLDNLLAHHHNRYVYQLDLRDAFPSVSAVRLAARLVAVDNSLGEFDDVLEFVNNYCVRPKVGLAQGAPSSSLLFELLCEFWLDEPILALLERLAFVGHPAVLYTRYVDGLVFSSQEEIGHHARYKLREIVRKAGFGINDRKTHYVDRAEKPAEITGGQLRYKKSAILTDKLYQQLERQLDMFLRHGAGEWAVWSLKGRIAWFESLERRVQGSDRRREIRRIADKVRRVKKALKTFQDRRNAKKAQQKKGLKLPRPWLQELRIQADIVWYVRKHLPYDWAPKATSIKCPCPFCKPGLRKASGRTRSQTFTVSPVRRTFHCYNPGCEAHGDIIDFAMRLFGWDFKTAALEIAREFKVPLPPGFAQAHGLLTRVVEGQELLL
jgi:hypothetical protein